MDMSYFFYFTTIIVLITLNQACEYERYDSFSVKNGEELFIDSGCSDSQLSVSWFYLPFANESPQPPEQSLTSLQTQDGDLRIPSVNKNHNGTYYFKTIDSAKSTRASSPIPVIVRWHGTETSVSLFWPTMDSLEIGKEVKLVCNFDFNPKPDKVTWLKNGEEMISSSNVQINLDILTISSLSHSDVATYMCRVDYIYSERPLTLVIPNGLTTVHFLESSTRCPLAVQESEDVWIHFMDTGGTFLKNGNKLFSSERIRTFQHNGSVHILNIDRSVESIDLINSKSGKTHRCQITVNYMDPPKLEPSVAYFGAGKLNAASFICTAGDSNPGPDSLIWFRNNQPVPESSGTSEDVSNEATVTKATNAIVLKLPNDYRPPFEEFSCQVRNPLKTLSMRLKFRIVTFQPDRNALYEVREGDTLTLKCLSDDSDVELFNFEWSSFDYDKDMAVKNLLSRATRSNSGNVLTVKNASLGDNVRLVCAAFGNKPEISGFTTSNTITVKVQKRFKFINPTVWGNKTFAHYIKAGQTTTISCQAEGPDELPPSISWSFSGAGSPPFPSNVLTNDTDLLFIEADKSQNGKYECVARLQNSQPSSLSQPSVMTLTFDVRVVPEVALQVERSPVDQRVERGASVQFSCGPKVMREMDTQPDTKWWFMAALSSSSHQRPKQTSSVPVTAAPVSVESLIDQHNNAHSSGNATGDDQQESKSRIKIVNETTLMIENVQNKDQGFYYCIFNQTGNYGKPILKSTDKATLIVAAASSSGQSMRTILIAVACAVGYILFMLALTIYCRKKRIASKNRQMAKSNLNNNPDGTLDGVKEPLVNSPHDPNSPMKGDVQPLQKRFLSVEKLQFPRHELQTTSLLGRGEFGDVFLAVAQGLHMSDTGSVSRSQRSTAGSSGANSPTIEQLVMVKSLLQKEKHIQEKFQQELEQYAQLRCVNVTRLVGICTETEPFYAIFEYTEWGDMKRFLMSTKGHNGLPQTPAVALSHKLHLAYQCLRGLEYFANHKLVHKDIAARNFLLTSDLVVKLSCASLCKDVYRAEYYEYHNTLIPLRWMPLEAVYDESFSQMSDAYSFGVTLWEIFSLGVLPYPELTNEQVLKGLTVGELKLDVPDNVPPQVAEIMIKCWEECAINRPSFSQMLAILTSINCDSHV